MEKNNNSGFSEKDGILTEYKTLRDEIISAKGRRLQTVSLTVGAIGAILSITAGAVLGSDNPSPETRLALPFMLPLYIISQRVQNWFLVFVLAPFVLWSLYLSYDMQAAISKGWKFEWEPDAKKTSPRKKAG